MNNDYSISARLFNWQSLATVEPKHRSVSNTSTMWARIVMYLLVQETKRGTYNVATYNILGRADYVSHFGSCSMNIVF